MEPYDLRLHQLTYTQEQIQDGNLDSFSNVIHYDSALIDKDTGKKPNTQQVSDSAHFAWSAHCSVVATACEPSFLPTPAHQHYSCQHFLPGPFQQEQPPPSSSQQPQHASATGSVAGSPCDLAREITQMVRDVYSEVEVPFTPLEETKVIPDWFLLSEAVNQDYNISRRPEHILAQPSRVKVTHVYNQSVWSSTPSNQASGRPQLSGQVTTGQPVLHSDIGSLTQIAANTSALSKHSGGKRSSVPRMADRTEGSEDQGGRRTSQPFESVAEALHLQQSVIGNRDIEPAPPEMVAQIIAEAERKLKIGQTPTQTSAPASQDSQKPDVSQAAEFGRYASSLDLPPPPQLPNTAVTQELIRIGSQGMTRTTEKQNWFGSRRQTAEMESQQPPSVSKLDPSSASSPSNPTISNPPHIQSHMLGSDGSVSNMPSTSAPLDIIGDDSVSVDSTSSEIESLNENATESFLKSLPPVMPISLDDIVPESQLKVEMRFSPPVKETSFRPVNAGVVKPLAESATQNTAYQSFVTDSGVFSPDSQGVVSPASSSGQAEKRSFVIPKPGPLFQSSPRQNIPRNVENLQQSSVIKPESKTVSDAASSEQLAEIRRAKAKLEGQLEMLNIEAQATLQERAELQAQVASLKLKLLSQKTHEKDSEKELLKADLEGLKQLRLTLENSVTVLQRQLEEKSEEGRGLQEELNQSQETCDKLNLKMKEVRDDLKSKEMTIQALKNKVAELYVEVQSSLQTKMEADNECRSAKTDLISLQSTKDWYQQQLEIATKSRSDLQRELTVLQAQAVSQSSIIERLKTENTKLRQQFSEIQNKALREKELLAKHLEMIESDMMDREAAFQEIQRERSFLEDTFNTKIQTAEDEKSRISLLMQMTTDLENQLDKAHGDLKKKQNQIFQLENENIELMKKLNISQETAAEKDVVVEELKQNMIELEARLAAFQNGSVNKDAEILALKEEKAKAEIALKSALQEKDSVEKVLEALKGDVGKVESSFKLMRQELNSKSTEMSQIRADSRSSDEMVDKLKTELENERRSYELAKQDFQDKSEQISDLQSQKLKLESEMLLLREKVSALESSHEVALKEKQILDSELTVTREKLEEVKQKLDDGVVVEKLQQSSVGTAEFDQLQNECDQFKNKLAQVEKDSKKDLMKQKARSVKLGQDLAAVKHELMERQKMFDTNIDVLSGKLRELAGEKEKMETELMMSHRKYELSMIEHKDQVGTELQNLAAELEQVRLEKQNLESKFVELQHVRGSELQQYQQQLSALEGALQQAQEEQRENDVTVEANQELMLELEKEKGRLAGVLQSNVTLKQHVSQLEDALAGRESALVDMQTQLQTVLREREMEGHENIKRVQQLEESLQKEKDGQRDVRKQIGLKITENKKLKRQTDTLKQDQEQLRLDLQHHKQEVAQLQTQLETQKQEMLSHHAQLTSMESEKKSLMRELDGAQQHLRDNLAREPVIQEQIKSLQWQLELKTSELVAAQEQMRLTEERQNTEMVNLKHSLQEKHVEIESLKTEVSAIKHDRQKHQAKISELRSALKSSLQHHKMTQKLAKFQRTAERGDADRSDLPPLPFDLQDMERLVQDTTVKALESKPLDNLQNCLLNLRSEISGLQQQMDTHTMTVETSTNTWSSLEQQVAELQHVVQTITNTTMATATTTSMAAAAVDMADKSGIFDI